VPEEWFSTPEWTAAAQTDFEQRLKRARPWNRPQYLRAKAIALRERGGAEQRRGARALNERIIRDYPGSFFDVVVAHEELASLAEQEAQFEQAIGHYREALHLSQEGAPTGDAQLRLPELLLAHHVTDERLREEPTNEPRHSVIIAHEASGVIPEHSRNQQCWSTGRLLDDEC